MINKDKKKWVYECDNCHGYFEEGFSRRTAWTEVGTNKLTEYYTFLCEKCFNELRNGRLKNLMITNFYKVERTVE